MTQVTYCYPPKPIILNSVFMMAADVLETPVLCPRCITCSRLCRYTAPCVLQARHIHNLPGKTLAWLWGHVKSKQVISNSTIVHIPEVLTLATFALEKCNNDVVHDVNYYELQHVQNEGILLNVSRQNSFILLNIHRGNIKAWNQPVLKLCHLSVQRNPQPETFSFRKHHVHS